MSKTTVARCLSTITATQTDILDCNTVDDEFARIKRVYFKQILRVHPDKGGSSSEFRSVQSAWEVVRDLYDKGKVHETGFSYYFSGIGAAQEADQRAPEDESGTTPSASWFEEAAAETVPPYKVEAARSDRSKCVTKATSIGCRHGQDPMIAKGEVRFGSLDLESGAYGRWHHLTCWRVPASIWLGLPDADVCQDSSKFLAAIIAMQHIAFVGFAELSAADQEKVVEYFMSKENYARLTKNSKAYTEKSDVGGKTSSSSSSASAAGGGGSRGNNDDVEEVFPTGTTLSSSSSHGPQSSAIVSSSSGAPKFVIPRPGLNGAVAGAFEGKRFVLTGVFPEVGGGTGLTLGKDRVRGMIESFGGVVTSAVSGATNYLVVGKEPGASKVSNARDRNIPMPDLLGLKTVLETPGLTLADAPQASIGSFSKGYKGNGLGALKNVEPNTAENALMDDGDVEASSSSKKAKKAKKEPKAKKAVVKKPSAVEAEELEAEASAEKKPKKVASKKRSRAEEKEEEKEEEKPEEDKNEEKAEEDVIEPIQAPAKRGGRSTRSSTAAAASKPSTDLVVAVAKPKSQRRF